MTDPLALAVSGVSAFYGVHPEWRSGWHPGRPPGWQPGRPPTELVIRSDPFRPRALIGPRAFTVVVNLLPGKEAAMPTAPSPPSAADVFERICKLDAPRLLRALRLLEGHELARLAAAIDDAEGE
ncbi:MAG: hypothetical protein ACRDZ3_20775 [Acidimicrobiia bacterium]